MLEQHKEKLKKQYNQILTEFVAIDKINSFFGNSKQQLPEPTSWVDNTDKHGFHVTLFWKLKNYTGQSLALMIEEQNKELVCTCVIPQLLSEDPKYVSLRTFKETILKLDSRLIDRDSSNSDNDF